MPSQAKPQELSALATVMLAQPDTPEVMGGPFIFADGRVDQHMSAQAMWKKEKAFSRDDWLMRTTNQEQDGSSMGERKRERTVQWNRNSV